MRNRKDDPRPRTTSTRSATRTSSKSLESRIKPVSKVVTHRSYAFYGRAGSGKTTLACTFPKPILLIDCKDEGTDSVRDVEGVDVLEVESSEDLDEVYWLLKENKKGYKTVILDTVTQLQQIRVEEVSEGKKVKGNKLPGDWGTLTQQDWGSIGGWMKKTITDFRSLGLEVVFIAQERLFNAGDEEEGSDGQLNPEMGPRLSPATMSHLCAAVHMVGHTFIRERIKRKKVDGKVKEEAVKEYCIRLGPSASYITKLRKPKAIKLPDFLTDPTHDDIIEIVTGD